MPVPLKDAVVERERRFLLSHLRAGVTEVWEVVDRYVTGTRLRLREVTTSDGSVARKLDHEVRLGDGPEAIACTSLYLDDSEWSLLGALPAEIDDGDRPPIDPQSWLAILREVTFDEAWTGARLAR